VLCFLAFEKEGSRDLGWTPRIRLAREGGREGGGREGKRERGREGSQEAVENEITGERVFTDSLQNPSFLESVPLMRRVD
jgi:hypothetical protein